MIVFLELVIVGLCTIFRLPLASTDVEGGADFVVILDLVFVLPAAAQSPGSDWDVVADCVGTVGGWPVLLVVWMDGGGLSAAECFSHITAAEPTKGETTIQFSFISVKGVSDGE